MAPSIPNKKERQYFIDWLRILLIVSVFFYHIGMIFREEQWHVNSEETYGFLEPIMWWLALWRMPLLFLVSGIGTYYALGYRTSWKYIKERFRRLYIPLTIGIFTLVPVQVYIEKIDGYSSLGQFYLHMFDGIYPSGNFSWHHLWFLAYLFLISMIIAPFIKFSRSQRFKNFQSKLIRIVSKRFGLNWVLIPLVAIVFPLRMVFPGHSHALMDDWAYFMYYMLFFVSGFVLFTQKELIDTVARQRRIYLYQALIFTALIYICWYVPIDFPGDELVYHTILITFTWSMGIAVLGYFKTYCNKENKWRKILNEGIYPFYLLHQPVIIVIAFLMLQSKLNDGLLAILITSSSLIVICLLYWLLIRRFNALRVIFGLKPKKKKSISNTSKTSVQKNPIRVMPSLVRNEKFSKDETDQV